MRRTDNRFFKNIPGSAIMDVLREKPGGNMISSALTHVCKASHLKISYVRFDLND